MNEIDGAEKLVGAESGDACSYGEEYRTWKSWSEQNFASLTKKNASYFAAEISKTGMALPPKSAVLEIGFGNGSFLAYGRGRQWEVTGTEINSELVGLANAHGFTAHNVDNLRSFADNTFDLIVAFDVLEHIREEALPLFLSQAVRTLKHGGCFIARFPNGDSPFSLPAQNGDTTHVTAIGSGKVRYFANSLSVEVLYVGATSQPLYGGGLVRFFHRLLTLPLKAMINIFVNSVFFASPGIAFCSNNLLLIYRAAKM